MSAKGRFAVSVSEKGGGNEAGKLLDSDRMAGIGQSFYSPAAATGVRFF